MQLLDDSLPDRQPMQGGQDRSDMRPALNVFISMPFSMYHLPIADVAWQYHHINTVVICNYSIFKALQEELRDHERELEDLYTTTDSLESTTVYRSKLVPSLTQLKGRVCALQTRFSQDEALVSSPDYTSSNKKVAILLIVSRPLKRNTNVLLSDYNIYVNASEVDWDFVKTVGYISEAKECDCRGYTEDIVLWFIELFLVSARNYW